MAIAVPVEETGGLANLAKDLVRTWIDGRVKLYLTHAALAARRVHPDVFTRGDYRPLEAAGPKKDHVVGFSRSAGDAEYVTLVPRLVVSLTREAMILPQGERVWEDTVAAIPNASPGSSYRNVLTGETLVVREQDGRATLPLAEVFASFPVALLRRM